MKQVVNKESIQPLSVPADHFVLSRCAQRLQMLQPSLALHCISTFVLAAFIQLKSGKGFVLYKVVFSILCLQRGINCTLRFKFCNLNAILFSTSSCSAVVRLAVLCVSSIFTIEVTSSRLFFLSLAARFKDSKGTCCVRQLSHDCIWRKQQATEHIPSVKDSQWFQPWQQVQRGMITWLLVL